MYQIDKSVQPTSLTVYKNDPQASYDNLPTNVKGDLKESLLKEQGFVCAYCMSRIRLDKMRIEHWACQDDNKNLELDYNNLLACCCGNEGKPKHTYICDKKKENNALTYSPANRAHSINSRIIYRHGSGKVASNNPSFDKELNETLNLNETRLVSNRKFALKAIHDELAKKKGTRSKQDIQKLYTAVLAINGNGQRKPFFGFLADYLLKKL
ncbi:retron system putative HNH endonuclease [Vibrio breoganii]|uniref:retron system putative HNH endonuclease n=1 Tax=Vibrio breoganii TaxID=553239 RepID=UPI000C864CDF|nr:retron system putative HNH endonuclease [Vibrio breoganii]PMG94084.1 TIGR02646 family protein [Vibrio breoganii]